MGLLRSAVVAGVAYKVGSEASDKRASKAATMVPAHACNCPYCPNANVGGGRRDTAAPPGWYQQPQYSQYSGSSQRQLAGHGAAGAGDYYKQPPNYYGSGYPAEKQR